MPLLPPVRALHEFMRLLVAVCTRRGLWDVVTKDSAGPLFVERYSRFPSGMTTKKQRQVQMQGQKQQQVLRLRPSGFAQDDSIFVFAEEGQEQMQQQIPYRNDRKKSKSKGKRDGG